MENIDIENFESFKKLVDGLSKQNLLGVRDILINSLAEYQKECTKVHKKQMSKFQEAKKIFDKMDESEKENNRDNISTISSHIRDTITKDNTFILNVLTDLKYTIKKIEEN